MAAGQGEAKSATARAAESESAKAPPTKKAKGEQQRCGSASIKEEKEQQRHDDEGPIASKNEADQLPDTGGWCGLKHAWKWHQAAKEQAAVTDIVVYVPPTCRA